MSFKILGSSSIVRSKTGPGGGSGGLGTRRTKKKGHRFGEEDDFEISKKKTDTNFNINTKSN